jgi:GNAT superfamily N-acetyltransferase
MITASAVSVRRCRDANMIERFLCRDYYGPPVSYFSPKLCRSAAAWLAGLDEAFFLMAEVDGECGGYVFSHTLGSRLWRSFARTHLHLGFPLALALARIRCAWLPLGKPRSATHALPQSDSDRVRQLDLPRVPYPFAWTPPDFITGYIEMLYVAHAFRGRGIASLLLRGVVDEMQLFGVRRAEAHIDLSNYASVHAFLNAGWTAVITSTDEIYASIDNQG